jgi:hypothetical protein
MLKALTLAVALAMALCASALSSPPSESPVDGATPAELAPSYSRTVQCLMVARRRLEDTNIMLLAEDGGISPWAHSFASGDDEGESIRKTGYYYSRSNYYPKSCQAGQYVSESSCCSCHGGQYQDEAQQMTCKECPEVSDLLWFMCPTHPQLFTRALRISNIVVFSFLRRGFTVRPARR